MRIVRLSPGEPLPEPAAALAGAVLARDLVVGDERWRKGRRLDAADLGRLARPHARRAAAPPGHAAAAPDVDPVTLLVPEAGDVHEDDAAVRLAAAVAGPGIVRRGPADSRIDLLAAHAGVVRVRTALLARLDAIDGISVFTVLDGQLVDEGALVAAVKTGPHLVAEASMARAEDLLTAAVTPLVDVRPYARRRVAAVVKETLDPRSRARFDAAVRAKVEALGSELAEMSHVADDPAAVAAALRLLIRGPGRVDIVLTAGAASTDPSDAVHVAFGAIGGRIVSHGAPAHPGSMLWLGRVGRTVVLGLPSCGAYSKATAADLVLPWLLAGEPATRGTIARLGHGGILGREMRFRFPPYAREPDDPEA